jgi:hypothetical protein
MSNKKNATVTLEVGQIVRQGDVLLAKVKDTTSSTGDEIARHPTSGCVLALGEATGHHHHIPNKSATMRQIPRSDPMMDRMLTLKEKAELMHEEHFPIYLPPGNFIVEKQEEYRPKEIVPVVD